MMYMCTSRFEIHEEERIMLSAYLSAQEIQAAKEERTQQQITVDPISDDEEDEGPSTELQATSQPSNFAWSICKGTWQKTPKEYS
jgi:hypothetical protein